MFFELLYVVQSRGLSVGSSKCCWQLYSFGETVSIPYWTESWQPDSFYDKIFGNRRRGLHTLCLLGKLPLVWSFTMPIVSISCLKPELCARKWKYRTRVAIHFTVTSKSFRCMLGIHYKNVHFELACTNASCFVSMTDTVKRHKMMNK